MDEALKKPTDFYNNLTKNEWHEKRMNVWTANLELKHQYDSPHVKGEKLNFSTTQLMPFEYKYLNFKLKKLTCCT